MAGLTLLLGRMLMRFYFVHRRTFAGVMVPQVEGDEKRVCMPLKVTPLSLFKVKRISILLVLMKGDGVVETKRMYSE
jgi:hypothetical protein